MPAAAQLASNEVTDAARLLLPPPPGLDFVWPFLLHYPRDRIAVIDDVCM